MADIKQDLLALEYSPSFELQGTQEAAVNLELPPVPVGFATVYGTVTDGTVPLADATVKLFDNTGAPFQHTLTDASGQYSLSDIPAGTYTISAVKDGYPLSDPMGVTLSASDTTQMALVCTAEPTLALGAIAGVLTTTVGTVVSPLAGAKIALKDSTGAVVASTYSAADGEFLFYDVADGLYTLLASAEGYLTSAPMAHLQRHRQRHHPGSERYHCSRLLRGFVSGDRDWGCYHGDADCHHQNQCRGSVPLRRCDGRPVPGQGEAGAVITGKPFCLCRSGEQAEQLCFTPGFTLCSVRVLVRCPREEDRLALCPWQGSDCWVRRAAGETLFAFLPPGWYQLELVRGRRTLCRLGLSLPPGANVTLWLDPARRQWSWRREWFHCFYNQLGGVC